MRSGAYKNHLLVREYSSLHITKENLLESSLTTSTFRFGLLPVTMSPIAYVEVATPSWEEICKTKRAAREAAIPKDWRLLPEHFNDERINVMDVPAECGIMSSRELAITETSARVLVRHMLSRKYSSHEVSPLLQMSHIHQHI